MTTDARSPRADGPHAEPEPTLRPSRRAGAPGIRFARHPLDATRRACALELLTPHEVERFRRSRSDGFLLGRLLVHELVAARTGHRLPIRATCAVCGEEHGAPTVDGVGVSIAHADALTVAAVGSTRVGIDVERSDARIPTDFAANVRDWTRLEAVLKADGRGFDADPARVRTQRGTATLDGVRYALRTVRTLPGFVTSVAWEVPRRATTRRRARRAVSD